jgi:hypothetical protein
MMMHLESRCDTLPFQDTTSDHFCPRGNFYFYFLVFFRKKTLKLARGPPYHMGKVIKSFVLGWQKIMSL